MLLAATFSLIMYTIHTVILIFSNFHFFLRNIPHISFDIVVLCWQEEQSFSFHLWLLWWLHSDLQ